MLHAMLVLFDMSRGASIKLYYDMLGSLWGWWFIRAPFFYILLGCFTYMCFTYITIIITAHHCPSLPITAVNALHFLRYANDEAQMNDIVRRYVQAKRKGDVNAEHQRLMDQIETTTMLAASQGVNAGLIKQKAEQGMVSRFVFCLFCFFCPIYRPID